MADGRCELVSLIVALMLGLTNICMFIVGIVAVSKDRPSKDECGPEIWGCVLAITIVRGLTIFYSKESEDKPLVYLNVFHIWALVCYYTISDDCQKTYEDNHDLLWRVLFIEVVLFYVGTIIVTLMCCVILTLARNEETYFHKEKNEISVSMNNV